MNYLSRLPFFDFSKLFPETSGKENWFIFNKASRIKKKKNYTSFVQKEILYTCSILQAAAGLMLQVPEGQKIWHW